MNLETVFGVPLHLKCEGFNLAGSVKLKAAPEMVRAAERDSLLTPDSVTVESSSGNLGVALSMIAAHRGYGFVCVTDSRCNRASRRLMESFGAEVRVVTQATGQRGLLGTRLDMVRDLCEEDAKRWSAARCAGWPPARTPPR
ncbi:pyridoxal-phosphate dependent enzyme [Streptomyces sp. NPDC015032]|uniref:pyridoxal-phosphate dependent enzyme n=1 Tax=Streptomyces sp. NPDC015032 TaxID=3364937 RepID=UPI0037023BF4